ncbi:MAG: hypothetical protein AMXMBFR7_36010 [Planctomycetota bacterium]
MNCRVGTILKGTVERIAHFGIFVRLLDGSVGFVDLVNIPRDATGTRKFPELGSLFEFVVIGLDGEDVRLSQLAEDLENAKSGKLPNSRFGPFKPRH